MAGVRSQEKEETKQVPREPIGEEASAEKKPSVEAANAEEQTRAARRPIVSEDTLPIVQAKGEREKA